MDITLAQADLARALKFAQRASDPKSPIPVLACLHARILEKRLYVEGSDLYTTAGVHVDLAEQVESGEALLPALFADYAGMMPEGMVRVAVRPGPVAELSSVAQKRRFSAHSIPGHDWPEHKVMRAGEGAAVMLPRKALLDVLVASLPVVSDDESKPMNAIYVRLFGGRLEVVATDGNRIQIIREDLNGYPSAMRLITAKRNARLLRRMLEDNTTVADMEMTTVEGAFKAVTGDYVLQARTFPEFIPYDQAVKDIRWGTRMRFSREAFVSMIGACSLESTSDMVISVRRDGTLKLGAIVSTKSTYIDEITPGEITDMVSMPAGVDSFELGVNPRFLRDAFNALPEADEDAILCFQSPDAPMLVTRTNTDFTKPPKDAMHLTVVMPMRL